MANGRLEKPEKPSKVCAPSEPCIQQSPPTWGQRPEERDTRLSKAQKKRGRIEKEASRQQGAQTKQQKKNEKKEKFDIHAKIKNLSFRVRHCIGGDITIPNQNIGRLRTSYKKESLNALTRHVKFNIGVITETHLLDEEAAALLAPGFRIMDKKGCSKHMGGGLIMVDEHAACKKLSEFQRPRPPADVCSIILYPTGEEDYQIRASGVCIPPSAKMDTEGIKNLSGGAEQTRDRLGNIISRLLVGDFNPNSWRGECDEQNKEWIVEHELWELLDPSQET